MLFYYDVEYENGCKFGGHNCTNFEIKDNFLLIEGYDETMDYEGDYTQHYWRMKEDLNHIKSFKVEKMKED